jgi:hypothetical protein
MAVQQTTGAVNGVVATQQGVVEAGATISRAEHQTAGAGAVPQTTTSTNLAMLTGIPDPMVMVVDLQAEVGKTFLIKIFQIHPD